MVTWKGRRAVVFGAGKMACGLLGHLLAQSGYRILFVARRSDVIDAINRHHGYRLAVAGRGVARLAVRNCRALSIGDGQRVANAVAGAEVVLTGVGIANLAAVSPAIAEGLWLRSRAYGAGTLNVVACENLPGAGAYLRHQIVGAAPLSKALTVDCVGGFSAALTRRIMTGGAIEKGELTFSVDERLEGGPDLTIDRDGLKGCLPRLKGVALTGEFSAVVMRKLFLLNCAQAATAYLGYREGCRYAHEAAVHPRVAPAVQGAVAEARAALVAEFPHDRREIERDAAEALLQIRNDRLGDTLSRLARDPRRKLSPRERLVGPARLAARHRLPHEDLCLAIAAALTYDEAADAEAVALQQAIANEGVEKVLTEDCGLLPHEELARAVKQRWASLTAGAGRHSAPVSAVPAAAPALERITRALAAELSQRYDPELVREVLAVVAEEYRGARVWSYAPLLMRRSATDRLKEALG